jgi:hypothetical protein
MRACPTGLEHAFGLFCEPKPPAPTRSRGPTEGLACLLCVSLTCFSDKTEGLSSIIVFFAGRTVVLGDLLTGWFE